MCPGRAYCICQWLLFYSCNRACWLCAALCCVGCVRTNIKTSQAAYLEKISDVDQSCCTLCCSCVPVLVYLALILNMCVEFHSWVAFEFKIWQSHGTELHATRRWWLVQLSSVSCLFEIPRSRFPHWPWLLGYNCQLFHRPLDCSSCHHHRLQNPVPPRAWAQQAQGGPRAPLTELHHSYQPAPRDRVCGQHHRHQQQGGERALGRPANNR